MLSGINGSFWGMATLGQRIAAAREMAGMNQAELARAVGVSRSAVNQWESENVKNLKIDNLFDVARVTGADIYWLGTDTPPPEHAKALAKFARLPTQFQKPILDQIDSLYDLAGTTDSKKRAASVA